MREFVEDSSDVAQLAECFRLRINALRPVVLEILRASNFEEIRLRVYESYVMPEVKCYSKLSEGVGGGLIWRGSTCREF